MDIVTTIERFAATAKRGATVRLTRQHRRHIKALRISLPYNYISKPIPTQRSFSAPQILEEAILSTLEFGSLTNQTALFMMREMEMTRGYEVLGYPDLREWAYDKLTRVKSQDTVSRLCAATLNVVASLDLHPVVTADGEKIDGLALISQSSPSSLMKLSGMVTNSTNGEREKLVLGLITGSSNAKQIRESVGQEPRVGKGIAVFTEYTENDVPMTSIHITCTYEQSKFIEKAIAYVAEIRFTERAP